MFCKNCGAQIDDNAFMCPHCQTIVETPVQTSPPAYQAPSPSYQAPSAAQSTQPAARQNSGTNVLAIVGFIFSFFIALVGLICSIIGYKNAPQYQNGGLKGLALAGIIISGVWLGIVFIAIITAF